MTDVVTTGLFTLGGVALGSLSSVITTYFVNIKARKDKYLFAMLDKRLKAYQDAYTISSQLATSLESMFNPKHLDDAVKWYNKNNLYLGPTTRIYFH